MKILYVANERRAAAVAAHALRGIAPNVTLTWAQTANAGLQWLQDNRDAAVLIVEASVQGDGPAPFVEKVRGSRLPMPVILVAPEHEGAPAAALHARADDYVVVGESLQADLPRVVTAAIVRRRATQDAEQRRVSELAAATARLAESEAQHNASLAREARICTALQLRLVELEGALRNADERRATDAAASADQLAKRHAEFTESLAEAARWRDALAQKLSAAMAALDKAREAHAADAAAAAAHLARREADLAAALSQAEAVRAALEERLAQTEAAHERARQHAAADLAAAGERHAALEDRLACETAARTTAEAQLAGSEEARHEAERRHAAELAAAASRLADAQAHYDAALTEHANASAAFERQLAEAAAALAHVTQARATEAAAATEQIARRDEELRASGLRHAAVEDRLAEQTAARTTLEQALAAALAARQEADRQHASELAAAATRLTGVQSQYEAARAEHAAARAVLEQQVAEAAQALEHARRQHASDVAAAGALLASRESELGDALAQAQAARAAVELALADASASHRDAQQRAAADLAAAAERQATLEDRLAQDTAARASLEQDLADSRTDAARTRRRFLHVVSAYRQRTREDKARLEAQLTRERRASQQALDARLEEIQQIQIERDTLQDLLATTREQLDRLHNTLNEERQSYERGRLASESELQRVSAEYDQLRQALDQLQTAFLTLERVAGDHAIERARLERVVADRDAQLSAQAEEHLAAEHVAQQAFTQLQERLRLTAEASSNDIARLQREMDALREELEAARRRADALRNEADRVPALQLQLEETQREKRRQFERAPYGLCECTATGLITQANHSLVRLLGYRRADDLRGIDFAATVFDDAGDLRWLLERAVSTGKSEAVETTWKTKDRRRLAVRLQALSTDSGSVDIVVEDLTNLRALEQRLRQAHRMEAVGRLASEVAVTCDTLLRDAEQSGVEWLAAIHSDAALRHQGEQLLADVTRAASLLRQLAIYGNKQTSAVEPVSVQRVLRDLEPVLKRVAGEDIQLVLPRSSAPADVDVEAERVERILVNVASYARQRMPQGGQVSIDIATTTLGRRFITRYPNVRPGAHVVITVTEARRTAVPELATGIPDEASSVAGRSAADNPRVDLGVLLELVGQCGGHLWMEAEPAGNMTLKIHLPKRPADEGADAAAPAAARTDRGRQLSRWFRTNSPAATAGT